MEKQLMWGKRKDGKTCIRIVEDPMKKEEGVVQDIARDTAMYIARKAVEEAKSVENAVDVMQSVVRHLMKKMGAERRER